MKKSKLKAPLRELASADLVVTESDPETESANSIQSETETDQTARQKTPAQAPAPEADAANARPADGTDAPATDQYELLGELGAGGMGAVYRAHRKGVDKTLALKKLHARFAGDAASVQRFQQEAKAASLLTHVNLVSVYDFGMARDGTPYLVMDYVDGISLAELIRQHGHLPATRVVSIFQQACEGLVHAHQKKVVHRDLKPNNIMLTRTDEELDLVKIVDFGIAKLMPQAETNQQRLTQTGDVVGSPVYMSPEQCVGAKVDERSDIYSLGCVMYESLMGEPPFLGENIVQTILHHLNAAPQPFASRRPDVDVPPALEKIVFKCLEKTPSQRYQTVAELRDDLELASDNLSPAREKFIRSRVKRAKLCAFLKRRERMVAVVAGVVITALLSTAWFMRESYDDKMLRTLIHKAEIATLKVENPGPAWEAAANEARRLHQPLTVIGELELKTFHGYYFGSGRDNAEKRAKHARLAHDALLKAENALPQRLEAVKALRMTLSPIADMTGQYHQNAVDLNKTAAKLIDEKKFDDAIKTLRAAISVDKLHRPWRENLARVYKMRAVIGPDANRIADLELAAWYGGNRHGPGAIGKTDLSYEATLTQELIKHGIAGDAAPARYKLALDRFRNLNYAAAAVHVGAARKLDRKAVDMSIVDLIQSLANMTDMATGRDNPPHADELVDLQREELELTKAIYGPSLSGHYGGACCSGSGLLIDAKRYAEAEDILRQALSDDKNEHDKNHMTEHLIIALAAQHKWGEAQSAYDQVLRDIAKHKGRSDVDFYFTPPIQQYLALLQSAGRTEDYRRNVDSLVACYKERGPDKHRNGAVYVKTGSGGVDEVVGTADGDVFGTANGDVFGDANAPENNRDYFP